jgi:glucan phosphoethanolaminetransferase (alkaline phosphatase superfamily)
VKLEKIEGGRFVKRCLVGIAIGIVALFVLSYFSVAVHEVGHQIAGKAFGVSGEIKMGWLCWEYIPQSDFTGASFLVVAVSGGLFVVLILLIIYCIFHRLVITKTVKTPIELAILAVIVAHILWIFFER